MYDDDASVSAVLRAGARGYVLKSAHQAELVAAIRAVARGEAVFGAQVADRVLAHFTTPPAQRPALPELTDRERQILAMLASGHTTSDIAAHLALAPTSVRNHLSNIFAKLHLADRTQPTRPGSSNRRHLPAARTWLSSTATADRHRTGSSAHHHRRDYPRSSAAPIRRSGAQCWPAKAGLGMRPSRLRQWSCQPYEPRRLADTSLLAVDALAAGM